MLDIETAADADLAEVRKSEEAFGGVRDVTKPLSAFLSFWHALKWMQEKNIDSQLALEGLLRGTYGDPVAVVAGREPLKITSNGGEEDEAKLSKRGRAELRSKSAALKRLPALIQNATELAEQEHFLHWEVAFPGVWTDWESNEPNGGFDAIIGNPPWDRFEFEEVHWFADRALDIALEPSGAKRKARIIELKRSNSELWGAYSLATERLAAATKVVRNSGHYKLLNIGKLNLYKLFLERAFQLVKWFKHTIIAQQAWL